MQVCANHEKIIIIADDDEDDCLLIKDALMDNGLRCKLRFVGDGIELMEYLHKCEEQSQEGIDCYPALILLDLNMPRKGGREALREIRAHAHLRDIPIVVLTTSDEVQDIELCRSLGAKLFITKPNMYNEWLEKMEGLREFI